MMPLCVAGLCVALLALTWVAANLVGVTHVRDAAALQNFTQLSRPWIDVPANLLLNLLDPFPYTCWALLLVAVALIRGRPRSAIAVALVALLAPLCTETLKPLMAHTHASIPSTTITAASWPSGHSTAAMTLALCAVLVAPRQLRALLAALGSLFAIAVGFSLLVLAWHMPSDVFAGYLVAGFWSALAVAALCLAERYSPSVDSQTPAPLGASFTAGLSEKLSVAVALGSVGLSLLALVLWLGGGHLQAFASDHRLLVVAASGIATLAVAICTTLTAALRT